MGVNVVATGSGPINLTGLTFEFSVSGSNQAAVFASNGTIQTCPTGSVSADLYRGFTGPASFGTGGLFFANTGSGDFVGITSMASLVVPQGYVSNTALSDSMTFDHKTIHSLGLTPGTYSWTWGPGLPNQNFTLQIVGPAGVPDGGSTVSLLSFGLLGLAALRRRLGC